MMQTKIDSTINKALRAMEEAREDIETEGCELEAVGYLRTARSCIGHAIRLIKEEYGD